MALLNALLLHAAAGWRVCLLACLFACFAHACRFVVLRLNRELEKRGGASDANMVPRVERDSKYSSVIASPSPYYRCCSPTDPNREQLSQAATLHLLYLSHS